MTALFCDFSKISFQGAHILFLRIGIRKHKKITFSRRYRTEFK